MNAMRASIFGSDGFFVSFLGFFLPSDLFDLVALFDLRFEGELLPLAIDVELDFSGPDINVDVCCTQEWPAQDERRLGVDFHVEYDEVDGNEEILDSHRDILGYFRGIANRLVH